MKNQNALNVFDKIKAVFSQHPFVQHFIGLLIALVAYAAGLMLIDSVVDTRLPLVAFAVFFLPAVLRAWLLVYWDVKADLQKRMAQFKEKAGQH